MSILYIIAVIYIVLLNLITSYRLYMDNYYTIIQKIIQFLIIWFLPIVGSFLVSFFLTQNTITNRKYSLITRIIVVLFMVKLTKNTQKSGYPSTLNEYSSYAGTEYNHCEGYGDGGGCAGD